jgi:hypothetical protein
MVLPYTVAGEKNPMVSDIDAPYTRPEVIVAA